MLDPARFHDLYNMIQSNRIDVILIQEAFLDDEVTTECEMLFPLIAITSNKGAQRGGIGTIINTKTTQWLPFPQGDGVPDSHILHKDEEVRLLMCGVRCNERPLIIGNVYAPTVPRARMIWLREMANQLNATPLPYLCDIAGGDWNDTLSGT